MIRLRWSKLDGSVSVAVRRGHVARVVMYDSLGGTVTKPYKWEVKILGGGMHSGFSRTERGAKRSAQICWRS